MHQLSLGEGEVFYVHLPLCCCSNYPLEGAACWRITCYLVALSRESIFVCRLRCVTSSGIACSQYRYILCAGENYSRNWCFRREKCQYIANFVCHSFCSGLVCFLLIIEALILKIVKLGNNVRMFCSFSLSCCVSMTGSRTSVVRHKTERMQLCLLFMTVPGRGIWWQSLNNSTEWAVNL